MYNPQKPYKRKILDLIKKTWQTPYITVAEGAYPIIKKKFSYPEVDHTDGIGTKGIYHWQQGTLKNAVLDALAMNLNDLALLRAVPYKLQDHIMVPTEDERVVEIIKGLSLECQKRKIAITGGEVSFQDNFDGLDISLTVSGFIPKPRPNQFRVSDVLIGLKSNGLHSNGFTTVRKVFGSNFRKDFVKPTRIYLDEILALEKRMKINGMMHITGGAFTKLKDLLSRADAKIGRDHRLKPQPIFYEIYSREVDDRQMYQTFNCGIGFILSVRPQDVKKALANLADAAIIGEVVRGSGNVIIESIFSKKIIKF